MSLKPNKNKNDSTMHNDSQTLATRVALFPDVVYQPKLLKKAPSMRAIKNYNNLSTETDTNESYDNLTFISENDDLSKLNGSAKNSENVLENVHLPQITIPGRIYTNSDSYDYPTLKSNGSFSVMGSELDVRKDELGSKVKLISPKMKESCRTCLSYIETILCTISLATGIGNFYRLPQTAMANGGLSFIVAYIILVILIGLPLLFLELGIGQIVQDGFLKTTRAVPFFRGIGYVKLTAGLLLSIYYPLYMGLSLYYLIWFAKSSPPFSECAFIRMQSDGYKAAGITGQECIKKTFLQSPFEEPYWFGINAGILLLIWFLFMAWCIKRTKIYEKALIIFLICGFSCLVALVYKAIEANQFEGVKKLIDEVDLEVFKTAEVWYYAAIQVFFSTNLGFGIFTSNAGILYKKSNPFWTSFGYVIANLFIGIVSTLVFYTVSTNISAPATNTTIKEIYILTHIYDVVVESDNIDMQVWSILAYMTILFAGFISMITIMYSTLKAISLEMKNKLRWWQLNTILSFTLLLLGCLTLLNTNLNIVHMLDQYVIGNLILIAVVIEVLAFIIFYGPCRIKADFEFILGNTLSLTWIILWCVAPLILLGIFAWYLATIPLTEQLKTDPFWLFILGWALVIAAIILILIMGIYNIAHQDEFLSPFDKVKASFRPARNWGPSDPMMLHSWKQWHSKAQDGERDFTLKRRGTKEYTHSVKNRSKYHDRKYLPTTNSDSSTISGTLVYKKGDQINNKQLMHAPVNYSDSFYMRGNYEKPMRVTALIDAIDTTPVHTFNRPKNGVGYKTNYNPLAYINNINVNGYNDVQNDGSTSEGYGTYRKGPYIVENDDVQHVCHRKNSYHEQATEF